MNMTNYQLEVFLTVVQVKKISTAAKLLHLTQPAVSSQIKSLENFFKASLFERTKYGVELTEPGQIVYKHAKKILASFEAMEREVDQYLNVANQYLIIGATQTVGNYAIPCSLWTFKQKYPTAKISLEIDNLQHILTQLADGQIDIAVIEGFSDSDNLDDFTVKKASSDELIIIYPGTDDWNETMANISSLKLLTSIPLILPRAGLGLKEIFVKEAAEQNLSLEDFNTVSELGSIEAIKSAVQAGFGFSICSRMAVQKELRQDTIRELVIDGLVLPLTFKVVFKDDDFLSLLAHRFIRFIIIPDELALCE
jgi:DNA-binding transcriptional LysR family regulator